MRLWHTFSVGAKLSNPKCPSIRQRFVPSFLRERNDQQSKPEGHSCIRYRFPDCPYMTNHCTDQKIHASGNAWKVIVVLALDRINGLIIDSRTNCRRDQRLPWIDIAPDYQNHGMLAEDTSV
jgi:hypothetical protein